MDEHRKKIIINEINHWKQNRLLPEHYCDFLLNLYTEGSPGISSSVNKSLFPLKALMTIFLALMLTLSAFLFYFTELSFILQITLIIFFGISSLLAGVYLISKKYFELIPLMTAALILLITTVQATSILFPGNTYLLYIITAANCLLWLGAGLKWKLISLKISGFAGMIILLFTIFI